MEPVTDPSDTVKFTPELSQKAGILLCELSARLGMSLSQSLEVCIPCLLAFTEMVDFVATSRELPS